jgi:hypothetical protein
MSTYRTERVGELSNVSREIENLILSNDTTDHARTLKVVFYIVYPSLISSFVLLVSFYNHVPFNPNIV